MQAIAKVLVERLERWRNQRFRAETRRVLAREAAVSLGAPGSRAEEAALGELEARLWSRIDAQINAETPKSWSAPPVRASRPRRWLAARPPRWLALSLPVLAAAALVLVLVRTPDPNPAHDGLKGATDPVYAPLVEAVRIAVVDAKGHVARYDASMHVRVGDALVFEAEVRGLDVQRPLAVDLTYVIDGREEDVVRGFALRQERQPFMNDAGYVAFKPASAGDYTFRLRAVGDAANAREMRVHVEP